jgi:hypothetical protein
MSLDVFEGVFMLDFNWGMFWALVAAFAVRGTYKFIRRFIFIEYNTGHEITLVDIWKRL